MAERKRPADGGCKCKGGKSQNAKHGDLRYPAPGQTVGVRDGARLTDEIPKTVEKQNR